MEAIAGWPVPPEELCGRVAEPRLAYENRPLPAIFVTIRPPPIASRSMGHPRCAMNGAPTLRDEWGTQALPSFGYDLVGGEIHLHDQNGVHVLMGEDRYSELATKGKV